MKRFLIKNNKTEITAVRETSNQSSRNGCEIDSENKNGEIKKRKVQNFREAWSKEFPYIIEKDNRPYCTVCNKSLCNNKINIKRHVNSEIHKDTIKILKTQPLIDEPKQIGDFQKRLNYAKTAELRIMMFIIEHNLPLMLISPLIELIKAVAFDSNIVKDLKCGKTKATETIISLLGNEAKQNICDVLKKQYFSIIVDETTDVSTSKCLALVCRFFDYKVGKIKDHFLSLMNVEKADSESIFKSLKSFFEKQEIPIKNLLGYAADNASVMMGCKHSVKSYLQKENPFLYVLNCSCHSLNLCASVASKQIPQNIEKLMRNIFLFFAHSAKRITEFKEFQDYFNIKQHKILKTSTTRWLSLEQVTNRVLEQWVALKHFFISYNYEEHSDIAGAISSEMTDINQAYLLFLSYILKLVNKLNLEFQSEEPRFHIFLNIFQTFYKTILSNFIKREHVDIDFNEINFENDKFFLENVYIGPKAQIFINSAKISEEKKMEFQNNCRNYYIALCKEIKKRINFNDETLTAVGIINPENLGPSLVPLISLFPNLLNSSDIENLEEEWRLLVNLNLPNLASDVNLENFWNKVFCLKNGTGELMFPKLKHFIGSILSFPHSSAACGRVFSDLTLIKNKTRNRLLFQTIDAIMSAKESIRNTTSDKWTPNKTLINNYKKCT